MQFWIIQGIGFAALIIGISVYQFNKRSTMLSLRTVNSLLFGIQYLLLGSITSMLMSVMGAVRNIIFCYDDRLSKKSRFFMLSFFILLSLILAFINWNGILSFLSCTGIILSTVAVWQQKEKNIRILSIFSSIMWLVHDILISAYGAIANDSIVIVAIIISIYRFDSKKVSN